MHKVVTRLMRMIRWIVLMLVMVRGAIGNRDGRIVGVRMRQVQSGSNKEGP